MSFEGLYQVLCENGHYYCFDVYTMQPENWICPACGKKAKWYNMVDCTNGSFDDDGARIDNYIELKLDQTAIECKCPTCGVVHKIGMDSYKIPEGKGHMMA